MHRTRVPCVRSHTRARITALAIVALSACDRTPPPSTDAASDTVAASASGAETFFRYGLVDVGGTRKDLEAKLGAADSIAASAIQNRHDKSQTDSILIAYYPGLQVEIYKVTASGTELTSHVRVSDNKYIQPTAPLRIGLTTDDFSNVMGAPAESTESTKTYACPTCTELGNERIEVSMAGGRIAAITIYYSID